MIPRRLWLSAFVISLSSFTFGYAMSALNTVLVTGDDNNPRRCYKGTDPSCPEGSLLNDLDLSTELQQVATAMTIVGAWMGCFLSSYPNEKLGRKMTLLANNVFFLRFVPWSPNSSLYPSLTPFFPFSSLPLSFTFCLLFGP